MLVRFPILMSEHGEHARLVQHCSASIISNGLLSEVSDSAHQMLSASTSSAYVSHKEQKTHPVISYTTKHAQFNELGLEPDPTSL